MKHSTGVNAPISNLIVITDRHLIANRGLSVMGDIFPLSAVNQQKIPLRLLHVNCARGMIMKVYWQANNTTSSPDQQANKTSVDSPRWLSLLSVRAPSNCSQIQIQSNLINCFVSMFSSFDFLLLHPYCSKSSQLYC